MLTYERYEMNIYSLQIVTTDDSDVNNNIWLFSGLKIGIDFICTMIKDHREFHEFDEDSNDDRNIKDELLDKLVDKYNGFWLCEETSLFNFDEIEVDENNLINSYRVNQFPSIKEFLEGIKTFKTS